MTVTALDLGLYAAALFALFLTPGPVWLALVARTLSGGFGSAWPLAFGVVVGDLIWPLIAILGVAWVAQQFDGAMLALKWVAAAMFLGLGALILKNAGQPIATDRRLTRPGAWTGFAAGVAVILSNPKAVLFYMGVLPGFFDLARLTAADIGAILFLSALVPLFGNLGLALLVDRLRRRLASPATLRRTNIAAGLLMVLVGVAIPLT